MSKPEEDFYEFIGAKMMAYAEAQNVKQLCSFFYAFEIKART